MGPEQYLTLSPDDALALSRAAKAGTVYAEWLEQDSDWDDARDDPRFKAILEMIN